MKNVSVKDIMTKRVITISPQTSIKDAAKKMKDNDIGSLILKQGENFGGIITYRDVVKKVVSKDAKPSEVKVRDVATPQLHTISPDKSLREAAILMLKKDVKRLPVMNGKSLVGIVSDKDILRISPQLIDYLLEELDKGKITDLPGTIEDECEKCEEYSVLKRVDGLWLCPECRG